MTTIRRLQYVALKAPDPATAAEFATEKLGFTLTHVDDKSRHFLKAHGPDAYSLVYVPGDGPGVDHLGYQVHDGADLDDVAVELAGRGVDVAPVEELLFSQKAALGFTTPAGFKVRLSNGFETPIPPVHMAPAEGRTAPAPIATEHVGLGAVDFEAEEAFWEDKLGALVSSRVSIPDGPRVMSFLRAPGGMTFHIVVPIRLPFNDIHHTQFSFKNITEFWAAHDALVESGVEMAWGPLRHGNGHNVAMYFKDAVGHWFEFATEEEVILDDEAYAPKSWLATDQHAVDEWQEGPTPPPELAGGPPPA